MKKNANKQKKKAAKKKQLVTKKTAIKKKGQMKRKINFQLPKPLKTESTLQQILTQVTHKNLDKMAVDAIAKCKTIPNGFAIFIKNVDRFAVIRPLKISTFTKLLVEMSKIGPKNFVDETLTLVTNCFILRRLFNRKILHLNHISSICLRIPRVSYFFIPELGIPSDYNKKSLFHSLFSKEMTKLAANQWKLYKEYTKYGYSTESLQFILMHDKIEQLKQIVDTDISFNINKIITESPFVSEKQKHFSLISFAARFGAVNCFTYLMQKGAKITEDAQLNAIKSGAFPIILATIPVGSTITNGLKSAVEFRQFDVFHWLKNNVQCDPVSLCACTRFRDYPIFMYFLNKGTSVNSVDKNKDTPLSLAAKQNNMPLVKFLISIGADPNIVTNAGKTPLIYAIESKAEKVGEYLIKHKAEINPEGTSTTPLIAAITSNNPAFGFLLISKNAQIDATDSNGLTALQYAVKAHSFEAVSMLLSKGANLSVVDSKGNTLLHIACTTGSYEIVQLLISKGLDVNARNNFKETPLHSAVIGGNTNIINLLVATGSQVYAINNDGLTAMNLAARNGAIEILKTIIKLGISINKKISSKCTPLHDAAETDNVNMIEFLIKHGARLNLLDKNGQTPLISAINSNSSKAAKYLIEQGVKVQKKGKNGNTPLHYAAKKDLKLIAALLLEKNADKNAQNNKGQTPLHKAAKYGSKNVIKLLIDAGADTSIKDNQGNIAKVIAKKPSIMSLFQYL